MQTNYELAIDRLKTAKSVKEWNSIREELKDTLTRDEITRIDKSGLIVQVLGVDTSQYPQS